MNVIKELQNRLPATRRFVERRLNEEMNQVLELNKHIGAQDIEIDKCLENIGLVLSKVTQILNDSENEITYLKELNVYSESFQEIIGGVRKCNSTLGNFDNIVDSLQKEIHESKDKIDKLNGFVIQVDSHIPNKPVLWNNQFERKIVEKNWGDVCSQEDFCHKYLNLIRGMDEESIQDIQRILSRQCKYLNDRNQNINLFTREEQLQLRYLEDNFYHCIFKISENLFAYKNYLLPINHFEPSVFFYRHGIDDIIVPPKMAEKTIIDVGGYIGDSILILNELPHKNIISFEADADNYLLMKKTISLNNIENTICENIGLSNKKGRMQFNVNGAMSSLIDREGVDFEKKNEVEVTTLDDYVSHNNILCGLIKVDIEGGEPLFLEGARNTIITQRPILLISIYHNAHDFFEIKPMIEKWELGYRFSIHKPTDGNITSETLLIAQPQ